MKKLIWYIDRDERISDVIRAESLQLRNGYDVVTMGSPLVIDEKLKERLPDLIFLDISIAGQDDASLIRDLKSRDDTKHIPIVLTAADVKIEDKYKELGADDFLGKPFDLKMFFEKADELLE
jgi:CheY-like chemotaxis protein